MLLRHARPSGQLDRQDTLDRQEGLNRKRVTQMEERCCKRKIVFAAILQCEIFSQFARERKFEGRMKVEGVQLKVRVKYPRRQSGDISSPTYCDLRLRSPPSQGSGGRQITGLGRILKLR